MSNQAMANRRGFTLIEVLVVVAIIALLISILLPSLKAAREQSKIVLCASGLHQIGVGLTTYVTDHRGELPALYRTSSVFTTYFMRVSGMSVNLGLIATRRYVKEPEVYYCPGQNPAESAALAMNGPNNKWISDAQWAGMTTAERNSVKLRSSYPARLIEIKAQNTQIGGTEKWEPMGSGKRYGWRQDKFYHKVVYADFTGVHGFFNSAVDSGYISSPHGRKGINRLFGDTSARWAHATLLERARKITSQAPTDDEQVAYYKIMDKKQ